jgi:hypothetical protein
MKNTLPAFVKTNNNKQKIQSMFSIITAMDFYDEGTPLKAVAAKEGWNKKIWLKIKNIFR